MSSRVLCASTFLLFFVRFSCVLATINVTILCAARLSALWPPNPPTIRRRECYLWSAKSWRQSNIYIYLSPVGIYSVGLHVCVWMAYVGVGVMKWGIHEKKEEEPTTTTRRRRHRFVILVEWGGEDMERSEFILLCTKTKQYSNISEHAYIVYRTL